MHPKYLFVAFLISMTVGTTSAQADDLSDLEKLQRQIDAAKAAKQSKPAAPARESNREKADSQQISTLKILSDTPCILTVNSVTKATLRVGITSVKIPSGNNFVRCYVKENPNVEYSEAVFVATGKTVDIRISLTDRLRIERAQGNFYQSLPSTNWNATPP